MTEVPLGTGPLGILDQPLLGAQQIWAGLKQMAGTPAPATGPRLKGTTTPGEQIAGGAAHVLGGAMQVASPLLPAAAVAAPIGTALTVGAATLADKGVSAGLKGAGVEPGYADLAGVVAAGLVGGGGAKVLLDKARVAAGNPEIKIGGKFEEPKPFSEMSDPELVAHANTIEQNPPKNYDWQKEQIVQEVGKRQAARGMPEAPAPEAPAADLGKGWTVDPVEARIEAALQPQEQAEIAKRAKPVETPEAPAVVAQPPVEAPAAQQPSSRWVYHGTSSKSLEGINAENAIAPSVAGESVHGDNPETKQGVYVSESPISAGTFAQSAAQKDHSEPVILRIERSGLGPLVQDPESKSGRIHAGPIPSNAIESAYDANSNDDWAALLKKEAPLPASPQPVGKGWSVEPPVEAPTPESIGRALMRGVRAESPGREVAPPTSEQLAAAEIPNHTTQAPVVETGPDAANLLQRYDEPNEEPSTFDKPHGIYTTPANTPSPYAGLGGRRSLYLRNPDANVLSIPETSNSGVAVQEGASSAAAGAWALRELVGPEEFTRLKSMDEGELRAEAGRMFPQVDWQRYTYKQEVMEGLGGLLARQHGYDAIELKAEDPRFTEYVGLNEKSMTPHSSSGEPVERGPGWVGNIPRSEIKVDAPRFQFKQNVGQGGASDQFKDVKQWDPESGGILGVWKDPADGLTYAVNGHHRMDIAARAQNPPDTMAVRYLDAKTAEEARTKGALINIREASNTASSTDAAKVFRGMEMTPEESRNFAETLGKGKLATEGMALSKLAQPIFDDVMSGDLTSARGAVLGAGIASHTDQSAVYELMKQQEKGGRRLTNDQVEELIDLNNSAPTKTESSADAAQGGLFGVQEMMRSLLPEKAIVSEYVRKQLATERKLFGVVGTQAAAERLGESGNVIKAAQNAEQSTATNQGMLLYDKLKRKSGPIGQTLDRAAQAIADGESTNDVKQRAYKEIRASLRSQVDQLAGVQSISPGRVEGLGSEGPLQAGRGELDQQAQPREVAQPVTDPHQVQEIRNSIAEGESLLKDGKKVSGEKFTAPELGAIARSVDASKAKIGEPVKPNPLKLAAAKTAQWHVYVDDKLRFSTGDEAEAMDHAALVKRSGSARKVAVGKTKAGQAAPLDISPKPNSGETPTPNPLKLAAAKNALAVAERKTKLTKATRAERIAAIDKQIATLEAQIKAQHSAGLPGGSERGSFSPVPAGDKLRMKELQARLKAAKQESLVSPEAEGQSKADEESAANRLQGAQLTAQLKSGMAARPSKLKPIQTRSMFDEPQPESLGLFGEPERGSFSVRPANVRAGRKPGSPAFTARLQEQNRQYGLNVREWFTARRDLWGARVNQELEKARRNSVPEAVDREALTLYRDSKSHPGEMAQWLNGTHPGYADVQNISHARENYENLRPVIEKALNPTPGMLETDKVLTKIAEVSLAEGQRLGFIDKHVKPEEYVTHLLTPETEEDTPSLTDRAGKLIGGKIGRNFPYNQHRNFPTIMEAIAHNYRPRTLDALEAFRQYSDKFATARATHLLIEQLRASNVGIWGAKSDKGIPRDWVEIAPHAHPFRNLVGYEDKEGNPKGAYETLFVPKVVEEALRPITDPEYTSKIAGFRKLRVFQSYTKAAQLSLSYFHATSENYMALSNMGASGWLKALKADRSSPEFLEQERDLIGHGGTTSIQGRIYEAHQSPTVSSLPTAAEAWRNLAGIRQVDQLAQKITDFTFGKMQRQFKVVDYATHKAAWLAQHPNATPAEENTALRSIAKEVNAVYGGLHFENLGINKSTVEAARAILLAPDWTFSNIFNVKYAIEKGTPAGKLARMFWLRAVVGGMVATQAASLMLSRKTSKRPTQVYMGTDHDGKDIYQNLFFKGAPGDIANVIGNVKDYGAVVGLARTVGNKMAPGLRTAMELMRNEKFMGGPVVPKGLNPVAGTVRATFEAAKGIAPIPWSAGNVKDMLFGPDSHKYKIPLEVLTTLFAGTPPSHVSEKPEKPQQGIWDQIVTGKPSAPAGRESANPIQSMKRQQQRILKGK
jgi:hypothetical protein